jgi:F-type H+-transporting ATPase subunit b
MSLSARGPVMGLGLRTGSGQGLHFGGIVESALASLGGLALLAGPGGQGFLEQLPDPMRPTPFEIGFVIVLVTVLYFYLRAVFFKPFVGMMEQREADMAAGTEAKSRAAAEIEQRQGEYAAQLRGLRNQAFARKKELADAAAEEKNAFLSQARSKAQAQRQSASEALALQTEQAKRDLEAQVDALSESMVQRLLRQA